MVPWTGATVSILCRCPLRCPPRASVPMLLTRVYAFSTSGTLQNEKSFSERLNKRLHILRVTLSFRLCDACLRDATAAVSLL